MEILWARLGYFWIYKSIVNVERIGIQMKKGDLDLENGEEYENVTGNLDPSLAELKHD